MFAKQYIAKHNLYRHCDKPQWDFDADIAVVIPCYNEPDIMATIKSVYACTPPPVRDVVFIVVNHSENDTTEIKAQNSKTCIEIEAFSIKPSKWISTEVVFTPDIPVKHAGAGMARKTGMDLAIAHFNNSDNQNGIIVSLDADTTVEPNYITAIFDYFKQNTNAHAATIYFEHPIENQPEKDAIVLYELNMRYYRQALRHMGFAYPLHTVGSAFCVKAGAYVQMGGMNRKKAGEDFYFLHKLTALGGIEQISLTTVFPSTRVSNRVPFGTGPAIQKHLYGNNELEYTYPLTAFEIAGDFFLKTDEIFTKNQMEPSAFSNNQLFRTFLCETGLNTELSMLRLNCGTKTSFEKRFFQVFNAFKILKWLNYAHANGISKKKLCEQANLLWIKINKEHLPANPNAETLLHLYRELEKRNR